MRRSLLIGRFHLRDRGGHDGSRPPVHLSNGRDRRDSVRHARVRQPWKTGPQHRGLWLVCDEVGPTTAVPMHSVQGHAQHEHGDCLQRASLHATGVRPSGASLRVEGVSISATARVTGHSRNTIARWLERASTAAKRFNDGMLRDFDLIELQADELCTFIGNKSQIFWLFATIEVSSRLWAGSVLGRRSDRNARAVINDVVHRGRVVGCPLIATDGFEYYVGPVAGLFGSACLYGQVLKTRRNNCVVRVERRVKIGTAKRLEAALLESEDSATLNTSFVERLNLTIRQGSAYLRRRSPCHARGEDQLRSHVELVRCHYNFVRPHSALRFGRETRTPAMQAGLVSTRLALSDIFTARRVTLRVLVAVADIGAAALPTLSWLHEQRTAA